jgi:hypothetical protein
MGHENFRFAIEFFILALVWAGAFVWGLVTGRSVMKAPLSAGRETEPLKYWMGQTFIGSWFLLCLSVAVWTMPSHIAVHILWGH